MAKHRTSLFRLVSGILRRRASGFRGVCLSLGMKGNLGTNYRREMVSRMQDPERLAGGGAGSLENWGLPSQYPQHPASEACDPKSQVRARENSVAPSSHLSTSKWFLELEFTGVMNAQSRPPLCDPMDCSPPGSSAHGILQARILEWVAMCFSRESSQARDRTHVSYASCTGGQIYHCSPWEALIHWKGLMNMTDYWAWWYLEWKTST